MRGIVKIVIDNGPFLKLITVATYIIHRENDLATPDSQLFSVKWLPAHTALQLARLTRLLLILYSLDFA